MKIPGWLLGVTGVSVLVERIEYLEASIVERTSVTPASPAQQPSRSTSVHTSIPRHIAEASDVICNGDVPISALVFRHEGKVPFQPWATVSQGKVKCSVSSHSRGVIFARGGCIYGNRDNL